MENSTIRTTAEHQGALVRADGRAEVMALNLPTLAGRSHERYATPKHQIATRLEERTADQKDEKAAEKQWRKDVIKRDGKVCRRCKRKVVQQLALAPERLEVHHLAGRADQATRWDPKNGCVLCAKCHGKVTRHEIVIVQAAKFLFRIGTQKTYLNASEKLTFRKAAA